MNSWGDLGLRERPRLHDSTSPSFEYENDDLRSSTQRQIVFSCNDSRTSIERRGWNKGVSGLCQSVFSCVIYSFSPFKNSAKASKKNLIDYQGNQPSESAAHFPPAGKPAFVLQGNALPRRLQNHSRRQWNIRASLQLWALPKGESVQAESPMILAITRAWIRQVI